MNVHFQKQEILELFFATFILSFIFSLQNFSLDISKLFNYFIFFSIILFSKETVQKMFASYVGYNSKIRIYFLSSFLALFLALIGIKLAAPYYTQLSPYKFSGWKFKRIKTSVEDEGKIVFISMLFLLLVCVLLLLFEIKNLKNAVALFLIFNLFPILPFDGTKILKWNFSFWSFLFIFSLILLIL